ncbi:hypothetical protein FCIRC_3668 [Fusarium circinatum]|uniref:Uncharacterized protein n=1 Tax=Fusarium circinatum TaxID=48490 RepID=A0A8H5UBQ5_FUSCI|nr:hypothetical protein FCIRC_3668 [Fusarium circinatum]
MDRDIGLCPRGTAYDTSKTGRVHKQVILRRRDKPTTSEYANKSMQIDLDNQDNQIFSREELQVKNNKANKSEGNIGDGEGDDDTTNESRFKGIDADEMLNLSYVAATKAVGPLPAQELPQVESNAKLEFDILSDLIPINGRSKRDIESIIEVLASEMSQDTMKRSLKQMNLISVLELDAVLQDVLGMLVAEHEGYQCLREAILASFDEEEQTGDTVNDDQ